MPEFDFIDLEFKAEIQRQGALTTIETAIEDVVAVKEEHISEWIDMSTIMSRAAPERRDLYVTSLDRGSTPRPVTVMVVVEAICKQNEYAHILAV